MCSLDSTSKLEEGDIAAQQMLTEVRNERQHFSMEKRSLKDQISRYQKMITDCENKETNEDPTKEHLKRTIKQLKMTIESKDSYACWVCNQQEIRCLDPQSDDGSILHAAQEQAKDEIVSMQEQIKEMTRELRHLKGVSFSTQVKEEPITPIGKMPSRDRIATPGPSTCRTGSSFSVEDDKLPHVQMDSASNTVEEVQLHPEAKANLRSSRSRISTPALPQKPNSFPHEEGTGSTSTGRFVQFSTAADDSPPHAVRSKR